MKQTLQNTNVSNQTVILRVDYNVPIKNGIILDDTKIRETKETIDYLLKENCKIIILSHLGKVKTEADKKKNSLEPIAKRLKEILNQEVYFSKENFSLELKLRVQKLKPKEILMLENTRFLDVPNKLESKCELQLSEFWANLGTVFVNDAFGASHRKHASTYGISKYLPSCIGFLMQKEIENLKKYVIQPDHPFVVVMSGAKFDDKLMLMEKLIEKCDYLLCGGAIANTCLKALDFSVGQSLASIDYFVIERVKKIMLKYKEKFVLPLDAIVGSTYDENYVKYKRIDKIEDNDVILDVGIKTLEKFKKIIDSSKTVFLNGTLGMYENQKFANGTKEFFRILKESKAKVIVGGGDSASAVRKLGYQDDFTYISSGGGATLEYLSTENLIALENIKEGVEIETLDL